MTKIEKEIQPPNLINRVDMVFLNLHDGAVFWSSSL